MKMDFKSLIDFVKYTLALAAGGFVYALEKFVPAETLQGRILLLVLLAVLLFSAILGIAVFAAATRALHAGDDSTATYEDHIRKFGTWHSILLVAGMLGLGGMLIERVLSPPEAAVDGICCCECRE